MPDNPRIEELRRRVQKDPASIAFAQLAEEYRRAGNYTEAVEVCRAGLEKHPAYLSARVTLGRALIELERFDEAKVELECVLRTAPENLAAIRGLAEIHQRHGDLGEALRRYQSALGIAKHDPDIEESVNELTRQLGTTPPEIPAPVEAEAPSDPVAALGIAEPPPIPFECPSTSPEVAAPDTPRIEFPDEPTAQTSPELEAAAIEFTKALEALDALSIDIPAPALTPEVFGLAPTAPSAVPAIEDAAIDETRSSDAVAPETPFTADAVATESVSAERASDAQAASEDQPTGPAAAEAFERTVIEDLARMETEAVIDLTLAVDEPAPIEEPLASEPGVDETPKPAGNQTVLDRLESWLSAIVSDRQRRGRKSQGDQGNQEGKASQEGQRDQGAKGLSPITPTSL